MTMLARTDVGSCVISSVVIVDGPDKPLVIQHIAISKSGKIGMDWSIVRPPASEDSLRASCRKAIDRAMT